MSPNSPGPEAPIVVKVGNSIPAVLTAVIVGIGGFLGGMYFERSKRADYTVRVVGVPSEIRVTGAPETITIRGAPERIQIAGAVEGIPEAITIRSDFLESVLKGMDLRSGGIGHLIDGKNTMIVVTAQGEIYSISPGLHPMMPPSVRRLNPPGAR